MLGPASQFELRLPYQAWDSRDGVISAWYLTAHHSTHAQVYDCSTQLQIGNISNVLGSTLGRGWFAADDKMTTRIGYKTLGPRILRVLITADIIEEGTLKQAHAFSPTPRSPPHMNTHGIGCSSGLALLVAVCGGNLLGA